MATSPHQIPVSDAAALTLRWRRNRPTGGFNGGRFDRVAFDEILAQQGCAGVRIYMALHDPADPTHSNEPSLWTFVLVGTDAQGNDITTIPATGGSLNADGNTGQNPYPCPPTCGGPGPLNTPP